MQINWFLKFCNKTKSGGGGQSPAPNSGGGDLFLPVSRDLHPCLNVALGDFGLKYKTFLATVFLQQVCLL